MRFLHFLSSHFLFCQAVFSSPTFIRTYAPFLSWGVLGRHPPGLRAVLLPKVPGELHFLLHCAKLLPFNHLASWLALCVGVCFSCFLTCILFGGVGISLSRWSPSQDILQNICEPETTGDFFFSFDSRRSLSSLHVANSSCKSQGMFLLQNNSLKTHTHIHMHTHSFIG